MEIQHRHATKLALCDTLEAIADSLPHVDCHICLFIAESLLPVMREAHAYEEASVFPAYASDSRRQATVNRLRAEHVEDEAAAEDLTETLLHIGHGGPVDNPEALGFMLRALFEGLRRHVAFEREHVMPLTRECCRS